jgi:CheY-like chemotaxis protein
LHVVVVEDSELRIALVHWLEARGHRAVGVPLVDPGMLEEAWWVEIDAAIIDLMLPGITGVELVQFLARNATHVRMVVSTGLSDSSLRPELAEVVHAVLCKPYPLEALAEALEAE